MSDDNPFNISEFMRRRKLLRGTPLGKLILGEGIPVVPDPLFADLLDAPVARQQRRDLTAPPVPLHPPIPPPSPLRTLLDGNGVEHRQILGMGNTYRPVTHFDNIPVRRSTIGGLPDLSPTIGPRMPERDGPFGGPALGSGGQSLFGPRRPPGASPFA